MMTVIHKEKSKMPDQPITVQLEIPSEVTQQDVWELDERLRRVAGITTELREPKDFIAATLLFIHIVGPVVGQAAAIAGGIMATRDLAQILYDFFHPKKHETDPKSGKNK